MRTAYFTLLACLGTALYSCKSATQNESQTNPPKTDNTAQTTTSISTIQPAEYEVVDSKKGGTVTFKSGSQVRFQDNCFETLNGEDVKGKVRLEWKEYHTLGEIMCSDISMLHQDGVLSSGGMFEIDGTDENHNPVRIKQGKSFEVELISERQETNFPFFVYDTASNTWTERTLPASTSTNPTVKKTKNNAIAMAQSAGHLFSIPLSTSNFPELKDQKIIGWYTKEETDFFSNGSKTASKYIGKIEGTTEKGWYNITVRKGTSQQTFEATPVTVENQGEFINEEAMASAEKFTNYMQELKDGKAHRTATLTNFGTYNWDILHLFPENEPMFCRFQHDDKFLEVSKAFFVVPGQKISVPLKIKGDRFHLLDNTNCGLVMIYPDNTVAILNKEDIKMLTKDQKSAKTLIFGGNNSYSFNDVKDLDILIKQHI